MSDHVKLSRRQFLRGAGLGSSALLIAACSQPAPAPAPAAKVEPTKAPAAPAPTQAPAATKAPEPTKAPAVVASPAPKAAVTLELWCDIWGGVDMWKPIFAEAKEKLNITVNLTPSPFSDLETKFFTAFAGGTAPDLTQGHPMFVPTYAVRKAIIDLTPYIEKENYNLKRFFPASLATLAYMGRQYGLPGQYVANIIYYNKKLFKDAGLTEPYDLWKQNKWTIETFVDQCNKIAKGEGATQIYACSEPPKTIRIQVSHLNMFGGAFYSPDLKKCIGNTPEALQGWDVIADHVRKKWSPATAGRDQNYQVVMPPLFNGNRLAMYYNHRGFLTSIDKAIDCGMVPNPQGPKGFSARGIGQGFIICSKTKFPDACWEWMKWQAVRAYEVGIEFGATQPMYDGDFESERWKKALLPWEKNDVYAYAAQYARPDALAPGFNEQDAITQAAYDEIALGKKSAKEAMDPAVAKVQQSMDDYYKKYGG
jgi:ABC-type glycerol-3-phosphate transport system substrate-binding protein